MKKRKGICQGALAQLALPPLASARWKGEVVGSRPTGCVFNLSIKIKKRNKKANAYENGFY